MVIPIRLNNHLMSAVVDTGAQVTMANFEACEYAGIVPAKGHCIRIRGIGTEMGLNAGIAFDVPITVGNGVYHWTIVVGDIREKVIIGLDFLKEVGVILDFQQGILQIAEAIVIASFTCDTGGQRFAVAPVKVNEKTTIRPGHYQVVKCDVAENFTDSSHLVVEQVPSSSLTFMHPGVVDCAPHVSLLMANLGEKPITLPLGTTIATAAAGNIVKDHSMLTESKIYCTEVEIEETAGTDCSTITKEAVMSAGNDTEPSDYGKSAILPEHLQSLYVRSLENLNGEEAGRLQKVLIE
jgi:hypothetical protein